MKYTEHVSTASLDYCRNLLCDRHTGDLDITHTARRLWNELEDTLLALRIMTNQRDTLMQTGDEQNEALRVMTEQRNEARAQSTAWVSATNVARTERDEARAALKSAIEQRDEYLAQRDAWMDEASKRLKSTPREDCHEQRTHATECGPFQSHVVDVFDDQRGGFIITLVKRGAV